MAVTPGFTDDVKETIHAVYFSGQVYGYGPSRHRSVILRLYVLLISLRVDARELIVLL